MLTNKYGNMKLYAVVSNKFSVMGI